MASITNPIELTLTSSPTGVSFSPTGDRLAVGYFNGIRIYDMAGGAPYTYNTQTGGAWKHRGMSWHPSLELIFCPNSDSGKPFYLFDVAADVVTEVSSYPAVLPNRACWAGEFAPGGNWLAVGGDAGTLFVYEVDPSGVLTHHSTLTLPYTSQVTSLSFSHDELYLAVTQTSGLHPTVFKNTAGTWGRITDGVVPNASLSSVKFSRDSYLMVVGYGNDAKKFTLLDIVADTVTLLDDGTGLPLATTYNAQACFLGPTEFLIGGQVASGVPLELVTWNGTAVSATVDSGIVNVSRVMVSAYDTNTGKLAVLGNTAPRAYVYDVVDSETVGAVINFPTFGLAGSADNNLPTSADVAGTVTFPNFAVASDIFAIEPEPYEAPELRADPGEVEVNGDMHTRTVALPSYLYTETRMAFPKVGSTGLAASGQYGTATLGFPTFTATGGASVTLEVTGSINMPSFGLDGQFGNPETTNTLLAFPAFGVDAEIDHTYLATTTTVGFPEFVVSAAVKQNIDVVVAVDFPSFGVTAEATTPNVATGSVTMPVFGVAGDLKLMLERANASLRFPKFGVDAQISQGREVSAEIGMPAFRMNGLTIRVPTSDTFLEFPSFSLDIQAGNPLAINATLEFPRFGKDSGISARKRRNTFIIGMY